MGVLLSDWNSQDDRDEQRRMEKVFPVEHPRLLSCVETVIECQDDDCGDDPAPNDELCARHRRNEEDYYREMEWRKQFAEDGFKDERGVVG